MLVLCCRSSQIEDAAEDATLSSFSTSSFDLYFVLIEASAEKPHVLDVAKGRSTARALLSSSGEYSFYTPSQNAANVLDLNRSLIRGGIDDLFLFCCAQVSSWCCFEGVSNPVLFWRILHWEIALEMFLLCSLLTSMISSSPMSLHSPLSSFLVIDVISSASFGRCVLAADLVHWVSETCRLQVSWENCYCWT